jgi:hypothetical protein
MFNTKRGGPNPDISMLHPDSSHKGGSDGFGQRPRRFPAAFGFQAAPVKGVVIILGSGGSPKTVEALDFTRISKNRPQQQPIPPRPPMKIACG